MPVAHQSINNNDDNGVDQSISGSEGNISTAKRVTAEQEEINPVPTAPSSPVGNHQNTETVVLLISFCQCIFFASDIVLLAFSLPRPASWWAVISVVLTSLIRLRVNFL